MRRSLGFCAVALILSGIAAQTMPAQTIIPDEATLKLFPQETTGIAFIDAAGLRNAVLVQELLQEPGYPRDVKEFIEATGFQPDRDIDAITVARVGPRRIVAIVRARYDQFEIGNYLRDKNVPYETYLGRVLYKNHDISFSLIDDLIVAGHIQAVKQVIDRLAAPAGNAAQNAELINMIRGIEAGNHVWAVGKIDVEIFNNLPGSIPPQAVELIRALTAGTYQMRIDHDVHVKAVGNFSSSEAAGTTSDLLRGLIALLKFQSTQNQDLMQLLEGVRIDNSGSSLTVLFDAPGDLLKRLPAVRRRLNLAE